LLKPESVTVPVSGCPTPVSWFECDAATLDLQRKKAVLWVSDNEVALSFDFLSITISPQPRTRVEHNVPSIELIPERAEDFYFGTSP
jgi:hypothetical protein